MNSLFSRHLLTGSSSEHLIHHSMPDSTAPPTHSNKRTAQGGGGGGGGLRTPLDMLLDSIDTTFRCVSVLLCS